MTDPQHLVHMANQIAQFFEAIPAGEPDGGAAGVAQHLRRYWTPAMRHALLDAAAQGRLHDAHPLVLQAVSQPGVPLV